MNTKLEFKLALRFVRSRRKGALTRFISFASTCGIAIGVFAAIVGLSAMNGFEYELENRVLSIIPSAQLNSSRQNFNDGLDIERTLRESPHVVATAPAIEQRAILTANRAFVPLMIAGIDPDKESKVIDIQRFVSTDLKCLAPNYDDGLFAVCSQKVRSQKAAAASPKIAPEARAQATAAQGKQASAAAEDCEDCAVVQALQKQLTQEIEAAKRSSGDEAAQHMAAVSRLRAELEKLDAKAHEAKRAEIETIAHERAQASGSSAYSAALELSAQDELPVVTLPRIVIGSGVAKKLQVDVGDTVEVVMLNNPAESTGTASLSEMQNSLRSPERHKALVIGIIHIGGQLDTNIALMHYEMLKSMANLSGPNVIHIRTDNLQQTNEIVYQATSGKIKESAYLVTWMSTQGKLYHDIQMVRQIMFVAMFLVMAVACFNIVSNLLMMVGEKRREIAILLTMGMKPRTVVRTFSLMGLLSGGYGALIGLILGVVVSLLLTPVTSSFKDWFGFDLLNENVYFINFIPCRLELWDVCLVMGISLLMSWGAALYPAWRAAHIKPAQELNL